MTVLKARLTAGAALALFFASGPSPQIAGAFPAGANTAYYAAAPENTETVYNFAAANIAAPAAAIGEPQNVRRHMMMGGLSIGSITVLGEGRSYVKAGQAARLDNVLYEKKISYAAGKLTDVIQKYLAGSNLYLAVVPDKNHYLAEGEGGHFPRLDSDRLIAIIREALVGAVYIDLFDMLSIDNYYRTDAHWDQRFLLPIAQAIADASNLDVSLTPETGYTVREYNQFAGLYKRRYMLPLRADTIYWLSSSAISAASMTGAGFDGSLPVYIEEKLTGLDAYDLFAGGPQSVLTIDSPHAETDRELIIFRDSFGGSLAPLLCEGYAKITLIDLRYIPSALLDKYVDFHGQDVLFLYSTTLLNSGTLLK